MQFHEIQLFILRSQERFIALGAVKISLAVSILLFGVLAAWWFGLLGFVVAVGGAFSFVTFFAARVTRALPRPMFVRATARELTTTGSTILIAEMLLT